MISEQAALSSLPSVEKEANLSISTSRKWMKSLPLTGAAVVSSNTFEIMESSLIPMANIESLHFGWGHCECHYLTVRDKWIWIKNIVLSNGPKMPPLYIHIYRCAFKKSSILFIRIVLVFKYIHTQIYRHMHLKMTK